MLQCFCVKCLKYTESRKNVKGAYFCKNCNTITGKDLEPKILPPTPPKKTERDTHFFIYALLISAFILFIIILSSNNVGMKDIKIEETRTGFVKNNIQASHSYKGNLSEDLTFDAFGELYGSSMQPTFFEGNTVLLKKYNESIKLKSGDMVRYLQNCDGKGYATIHRINAVYDEYLVMIGDNVLHYEYVEFCQITDVVIGIIYT